MHIPSFLLYCIVNHNFVFIIFHDLLSRLDKLVLKLVSVLVYICITRIPCLTTVQISCYKNECIIYIAPNHYTKRLHDMVVHANQSELLCQGIYTETVPQDVSTLWFVSNL